LIGVAWTFELGDLGPLACWVQRSLSVRLSRVVRSAFFRGKRSDWIRRGREKC